MTCIITIARVWERKPKAREARAVVSGPLTNLRAMLYMVSRTPHPNIFSCVAMNTPAYIYIYNSFSLHDMHYIYIY